MRIQLVAAGTRIPAWVAQGFDEYAGRMPRECALVLKEIPLGKRTRNADTTRAVADEGKRMLAAVNDGDTVVALDVAGRTLDTEQFSGCLGGWLQSGRNVSMLIGGPDGLARECLDRADLSLSLSAMTLPHGLVRVLAAEQLYRAWSVLNHHPYHRA
jgi:23S rRNA (pseudouridine1915-N3)-methyltransferase